ncbi:hypothetical protein ACHAXA_005176 [Cyclostephanos tholiformis]|uniref:Transglutaminase-like domain-containing protein n=1 Tax=Cyclostephanos tholiformis TaxID=382380 RepID=A0ABD3RTY8_9STRA
MTSRLDRRRRPFPLTPRGGSDDRHSYPDPDMPPGVATTAILASSTVAEGHESSEITTGAETMTWSTSETSSMANDDDDDDDDESEMGGRTSGEVAEDYKDGTRRTISAHVYRRRRILLDDATGVVHPSAMNDVNASDCLDNDFFALISDHVDDESNDGPTLTGIGMPRRQFATWVHYYLTHMTSDGEVGTSSTTSSSTIVASTTTTAAAPTTFAEADAVMREERALALDEILRHVATRELDWNEEDDDDDDDANAEDGGIEVGVGGNDEGGISMPSFAKQRREQREAILRYWIGGRLICEHTNLLSNSRRRRRSHQSIDDGVCNNTDEIRLQDVATDDDEGTDPSKGSMSNSALRKFIEKEYGSEDARLIMARTLLQKSEIEQLKTFESFLGWFRMRFPYYHDACDSCGASCKDDPHRDRPAPTLVEYEDGVQPDKKEGGIVENAPLNSADDAVEDDEDTFSFLGYVHPTPIERRYGHASRTELYRCRSCDSYTRFPRYNRAAFVMDSRRGRCGEYSMLLYRMLRALGYDGVRWVVDWADHVWVEIWLGGGRADDIGDRPDEEPGRWVHLDPCEAAVDNPLLYESWGKNQTYIVAFHDPFYVGDSRGGGAAAAVSVDFDDESSSKYGVSWKISGNTTASPAMTSTKNKRRRWFFPVEDVTRQYTSDEIHVIEERRGINDTVVSRAIDEAANSLVDMLQRSMRGAASRNSDP